MRKEKIKNEENQRQQNNNDTRRRRKKRKNKSPPSNISLYFKNVTRVFFFCYLFSTITIILEIER